MSSFHDKEHPYVQQVLERAKRDRRFHKRLKQDPRAAIKEETGIDVPPGFGIRFVERFGRRDLMALFPERPPEEENVVDEEGEEDDDELDLEDLEEAAGGTGDDPPPDPPEGPW